jgi:hypothetical protein
MQGLAYIFGFEKIGIRRLSGNKNGVPGTTG